MSEAENKPTGITLEKVLAEWKQDSTIDQTKLDREMVRTPSMHAKYVEFFVVFKAKLAGAEKDLNKFKWVKRKYFRGEMEPHELAKYGWSQWQGLKPSQAEINQLFEMDRDIVDKTERVESYKAAVAALEYIMRAITSREFTLKTLFEYQKFVNG